MKGTVVIISKPNDPDLYGPVELSFSLDIAKNQTFRYWTSEQYKLEEVSWAQRDIEMYKKNHPDWTYTMYKVDDPKLPVVLDWAKWEDACTPTQGTLSGVKNKYNARNMTFYKKNNHELAAAEMTQS